MRLEEVSLVDRPAQTPAVVALRKAADAEHWERVERREVSREERERLAESGAAMPGGQYPIRDRGDLRAAIQAFGRAAEGERAAVARHIARRARALGATDDLPTSGDLAELIGRTAKEDDMTDEQMAGLSKAMGSAVEKAMSPMQDMIGRMAAKMGVEKAASEAQPAAASEAQPAAASEAQPAAASEAQPAAASEAQPAAADAPLAEHPLVKALQAKVAQLGADAKAAAEALALEKRRQAAAELAGMGGSDEERLALAAALETVPEAQRAGVRKMLDQRGAESLFLKRVGVAGTADLAGASAEFAPADGAGALRKRRDDAADELDRMSAELRKSKPELSEADAYAQVSEANPELLDRAVGVV